MSQRKSNSSGACESVGANLHTASRSISSRNSQPRRDRSRDRRQGRRADRAERRHQSDRAAAGQDQQHHHGQAARAARSEPREDPRRYRHRAEIDQRDQRSDRHRPRIGRPHAEPARGGKSREKELPLSDSAHQLQTPDRRDPALDRAGPSLIGSRRPARRSPGAGAAGRRWRPRMASVRSAVRMRGRVRRGRWAVRPQWSRDGSPSTS